MKPTQETEASHPQLPFSLAYYKSTLSDICKRPHHISPSTFTARQYEMKVTLTLASSLSEI